jgi:hypothetical protein
VLSQALLGAATAEEADVEKAAKAALRRLAEQRATGLLVYDNVSSPEEIADLLPSAGARVLITSRFPECRRWAEQVALDVLPLEEAVALIQKLTVPPMPLAQRHLRRPWIACHLLSTTRQPTADLCR